MSCHTSMQNCLSSTRLVSAPAEVEVQELIGMSYIPVGVCVSGGSDGEPLGVPVMTTGWTTVGEVDATRLRRSTSRSIRFCAEAAGIEVDTVASQRHSCPR